MPAPAEGTARGEGGVAALRVRGLQKSFPDPEGGPPTVVRLESLDLPAGGTMALRGESGSGKTTLLHLIAGILPADEGRVEIAGEPMTGRGETARDRLRARRIGYLFQTFNLLPHLTALENVALGLAFRGGGTGGSGARSAAAAALARTGLEGRLHHRPSQLSVGQQQRVAIARALVGRPSLVLADEPTAHLDRERARASLDLLLSFAADAGAALLVVSHDEETLARFPTVVTLGAAPAGTPS
jgi:putative ABC transport system ATP-binding protein